LTTITATALTSAGYKVDSAPYFDTIKVDVSSKGKFSHYHDVSGDDYAVLCL